MEYRRRMMGKKKDVDYSLRYFTLKALQAGTFMHSNFDVDYSVDGGHRWATLSAGSSTPTVQAGTKVMFRGNITPSTSYGVGTFTGTNNFEAEGNVMSLLYGGNFVGQKDLTGKNYAFHKLLNGASYLTSVENLSLPATTLSSSCYRMMFCSCTSLTTAPELPATTLERSCYSNMFKYCKSLIAAPELPATILANYCYEYMFYFCSKLNYIKAMFTTAPGTSYTENWVSNVAKSGTYVKNSTATYTKIGNSAIPSGWTVTTASS